jgi:8-oxo-dGTP pyrophosphatase MutT (NUDIX family)
MDVHIHNYHGPEHLREPAKPQFPAFAWVVIQSQKTGKFLMVNEPAGIARGRPRYWLPAGRVDKGEGIIEAGIREAEEEAGLKVKITGVLHFMNEKGLGCPRIVLMAAPIDEN